MQERMGIMYIYAAGTNKNKLCKSSLNAITPVSTQQGRTCPLCLLEGECLYDLAAVVQNALSSRHSKVTRVKLRVRYCYWADWNNFPLFLSCFGWMST